MQQDVDLSNNKISELENWLKLAQIPNFSVVSLKKLKQKFDIGLPELFVISKASLQEIGFNNKQIEIILHPDIDVINSSLQWLSSTNNRFLLYFDHPSYPIFQLLV